VPTERGHAARDALAPLALNAGTYVNAMGEPDEHQALRTEPSTTGWHGSKPSNDPGNVFHRNINISPPDSVHHRANVALGSQDLPGRHVRSFRAAGFTGR
jgi:hypothetical protein